MSPRSSSEFGSLADRVARSKAGGQASGRTPAHVDIRADDGTWQPALLITWHHTGTGWWGRTVWAPDGEAIEELVRADRLRPVTSATGTTAQTRPGGEADAQHPPT